MAAYGLDIGQVMAWTFPQLRLLNRRKRERERVERRWQLMLASGSLSPEMLDSLWQSLGGEPLDLDSQPEPATEPSAPVGGGKSHQVDRHGNVVAPGAPLLSDIAEGKAVAPAIIPITVIGKHKKDGQETNVD